jgi:sarcosine/dimethylglycine N-methyltransferase
LTRRQFGPKGVEVTDIQTQYWTGASRRAIEQALVAAGKDLSHLRPEDLALLEDFREGTRRPAASLTGTRATASLSASPHRTA